MKKLAILGSTGSVGTQTLDVIRHNSESFRVTALSCGKNIGLMRAQIKEFEPELVCVENEEDAAKLSKEFPKVAVVYGKNGLIDVATYDCDMVVNSLVGMRGLEPTYRAILRCKDIALANKETLVTGGELVMKAAADKGVRILPVDSEHSAIFQCLEGNRRRPVRRILLTASGGPFRGYSMEQLENVTLEQALAHPSWVMGPKITVDSATMMNKGLEVIEARWLFDIPAEKIQILVHPQSIMHSAVEYMDNSVIAQLGAPDMRIPISLALGYPNRIENHDDSLNFFKQAASLTFEEPRPDVFRCIKMAYEAIEMGGSYPVVLNAANEVLVEKFLNRKIKFIDIQKKLEKIIDSHKSYVHLGIDDIYGIDAEIRKITEDLI